MPIATTPVVRIIDVQTFLAQEVLNVYYWLAPSAVTPDLTELGNQFNLQVIAEMLDAQSVLLTHTEMRLQVVTELNSIETIIGLTARDGTATGQTLSPFSSYKVRLNRSTAETRSGSKRVGGLTEGSIVDGLISNTFKIIMQGYVDAIDSGISDGVVLYDAVIARPTSPPTTTWLVNPVLSSTIDDPITTQNTRKFGRGN